MESELKFSAKSIELEKIIDRAGCYDLVEENGTIWFWWFNANGLCQLDHMTKSANIVARYKDSSDEKKDLYRAIQRVGNKLVLAPRAAKEIAIYNIDLKKMSYIDLIDVQDNRKEKYDEKYKFVASIKHRNAVYLLGYRYPAIVKVDMETLKVTYITKWVDEIESRIQGECDKRGYLIHAIVIEETAWITCGNTNALLKLNLITDEISVIDIPCRLDGFGGIAWANKSFWLVGRGKNSNIIVKWNVSSTEIEEIEVFSSHSNRRSDPFQPPIVLNDKILLFPISGKHVYEIDAITKEIVNCAVFEGLFDNDNMMLCPHAVAGLCKMGKKILFITGADFL